MEVEVTSTKVLSQNGDGERRERRRLSNMVVSTAGERPGVIGKDGVVGVHSVFGSVVDDGAEVSWLRSASVALVHCMKSSRRYSAS